MIRRFLCILFAFILIFCSFSLSSFSVKGSDVMIPGIEKVDFSITKKTNDISLRDPFVILYGGYYFIYGTGAASGLGYGCYVSKDLENWAGPVKVFTPPIGFPGTTNYWAPECHLYNGSFYLFATYFSSLTNHRGVSIFKSESPLGPFQEITNGHATPSDWDAIDGTLYIDENNQPWMVFVHEWTSMTDGIGDFSAAKLSDDLTHFISAPISLFNATEMPGNQKNKVTDGCWLYRTKTNELLMLWSGDSDGYCVAVAKSSDGTITGKWKQDQHLLYYQNRLTEFDGGHGMLFKDTDNRLMLSIHSPNDSKVSKTIPLFMEVIDKGSGLELKEYRETNNVRFKFENFFRTVYSYLLYTYTKVSGFFIDLFN